MGKRVRLPSDTPSMSRSERARGTLRTMLEQLEDVEAARILVVRRIGKLGSSSQVVIRKHFAQYGTVSQVLVPGKKRLNNHYDDCGSRPGNLGLVVMESVTSAELALEQGEFPMVAGVELQLRRFERQVDAPRAPGSKVSEDMARRECPITSKDLSPQHVSLQNLASMQVASRKSDVNAAKTLQCQSQQATASRSLDTPLCTAAERRVIQKLMKHVRAVTDAELGRMLVCHNLGALGISSQDLLMEEYSKFGDICHVYVAHTKLKLSPEQEGQVHTCPGELGILVMASEADVQQIIAEGEQQEVAGHKILVHSLSAEVGETIVDMATI